MSDGIDFAWYLLLWTGAHLGDERAFWKTATPARCDALARVLLQGRHSSHKPSQTQQGGSLYAYFMGGGA